MIGKKVANKKKSGSSSKAGRIKRLADYITNPELVNGHEKCVHHEANNFLTDDLQSQVQEMIALAHEAVRSKDPVDHYVLSWQTGEVPTVAQAREAVKLTMQHLGLEAHQMIWAMHADTDNFHIHIEVNRVHPVTLKVVEVNKGFQRNAIQQAAAIVEKVQGWKPHEKSRFKTDDLGHLVTNNKGIPMVFEKPDVPQQPTGQARDREIQTGAKSAQRVGIEQAAPIIAAATSWKQLHAELANVGIEYKKEGSGAKIYINEIGVKASDVVDRKNNFGALEKRLGLYQPSKPTEIKNDEFNRTKLFYDSRYKTGFSKPYSFATEFRTFDTLRVLPSSRMDVTAQATDKKSRTKNLLLSHESLNNRGAPILRRGGYSDIAERRTRTVSSGEVGTVNTKERVEATSSTRFAGPESSTRNSTSRKSAREVEKQTTLHLTEDQPGWAQHQQIKAAQYEAKRVERLALSIRHDAEKAELKAAQKVERDAALKEVPKGNGAALNAMRSLIAEVHNPVMLAQRERHKAEREALQTSYKALQVYKVWQAQPQIVSEQIRPLAEQRVAGNALPSRVTAIIRQLKQRPGEHRQFTYSLDQSDVFRDEGKIIKILDLNSQAGIAAALATAQQKFGNVLTLTGTDAFKRSAVATAVEYGLTCRFDSPQLEKLRVSHQAQKDAGLQADRDRAAAEKRDASRKLELQERTTPAPAPLYFPIQQTGAAVPPVVPSAEHQPPESEQSVEELDEAVAERRPGAAPAPDYLDEIHKQIEAAKAAADQRGRLVQSATVEGDHDAPASGTIVAANDEFVAVHQRDAVKIYRLAELSANVTYDGTDTGRGRFAPGNEIERKNGRDGMRTLVTEHREHMHTKEVRERNNDFGI